MSQSQTAASRYRTLARELVRDSSAYAVVQALAMISPFILVPVYVKHLPPAEYGVLAVSDILTAVLEMLLALGLPAALARLYLQYTVQDRPKYCCTLLIVQIAICLLAAAILSFGGDSFWYALIKIEGYSRYAFFVIGIACFTVPANLGLALFQTRRETGKYAVIVLFHSLTTLVMGVLLVAVFDMGLIGALTAKLVGSMTLFIVTLPFLLPLITPGFTLNKLPETFAFALPLLPHNLARWATASVDVLLISFIGSPHAAGIYAFGRKIATILELAITGAMSAWVPLFYSRAGDADIRPAFGKLAVYFGLGMIVLGACVSVLSRELIKLLANVAYLEAALVIPWLAGTLVFRSLYAITVPTLSYLNRTGLILICTLTSTCLNLVLNLVLIPRFSIDGASVASLASTLILFVTVHLVGQKWLPIPWNYKALILGFVGGVAVIALSGVIANAPAGLILRIAALASFTLVVSIWAFRDYLNATVETST